MPLDPQQALQQHFGLSAFRGRQLEVIEHVLAGGDALLVMPTGGGKSLCYQLPALLRPGLAVVVSPLIALMHDQVAALQAKGLRAAFLNSAQTSAEMSAVRQAMEEGDLDLLYVAPERLMMPGFLNVLDRLPLALFAIDEAHCVSQWGHDFRPEYLQLSVLQERYPGVPRLALTATADPETREEIVRQLHLHNGQVFIAGFDRPNLRYLVQPKTKDHKQALLRFIKAHHDGQSGIVYRLTRNDTDKTAEWLQSHGVNAIPYHAGLDDDTRKAHQDRFLGEQGIVVVATIAFGMGVDKPDVRFVAHLDMPKSLEDYHQQTGRAGRDGEPADAWMVFGAGDLFKLRHFINSSEADERFKVLERRRLRDMERFCTTSACRRRLLLEHFGEQTACDCGNCDNCRPETKQPPAAPAPKEARVRSTRRPEITDDGEFVPSGPVMLRALSCVIAAEQSEGLPYVARKLAREEVPGSPELTAGQWETVLRVMLEWGYLRSSDQYRQILTVGPKAGQLIQRGQDAVAIKRADGTPAPARKEPKAKKARKPAEQPLVGAEGRLWERLRALRTEIAARKKLPAYCILSDDALRGLARERPQSEAEMLEIKGIGPAKLEQYGPAFLDVIREFGDA